MVAIDMHYIELINQRRVYIRNELPSRGQTVEATPSPAANEIGSSSCTAQEVA